MNWPFFGLVCRGHSWPAEVRKWQFFSVFLCQRCREIWREILVQVSMLHFPGFGCPRENFTQTSRQKRCEKRMISRNFHSAGAWRCKNLVPVTLSTCNSRARNGCANSMGAWYSSVLSQGKRSIFYNSSFQGGGVPAWCCHGSSSALSCIACVCVCVCNSLLLAKESTS